MPVPTQGYACPPGSDPTATLGQHFQPMFLYESMSGLVGMLALIWLARRLPAGAARRPAPGVLHLVRRRRLVESLKADNWRIFGVPTAQIVAAITVVGATAILIARHSRRPDPGRPIDLPSTTS